jgi:homoserine O-succinyltransferase
VFFQGHPEYEARTLMGEYRRDVRRFLRGERASYPPLPRDYFDESTARRLIEFRRRALADRREALIEAFPTCSEEALEARWRPAGERLMANWLGLISDTVQATHSLVMPRESGASSKHLRRSSI